MSKNLILIKLGGSFITDKEKPGVANVQAIKSLANQIKKAREAGCPDIIVGHGSGSFAHVPAKKYRIVEGIKSPEQIKGMCLVAAEAAKLNRIVVDIFLEEGLSVQSFPPSSWISAKDGDAENVLTAPLYAALSSGIVPIVYGDMITDVVRHGVIFSTEAVFRTIIENPDPCYKTARIIQVGRTAGLLDAKGNTILHINTQNFPEVKKLIGVTKGYDVTGGMLHKIQESLNLAQGGIGTILIGGAGEDELLKALKGETTSGTIIG